MSSGPRSATEEQTLQFIHRLAELRAQYGRADVPFEIQVSCIDVFDVAGYERLGRHGVTDIITQPWLLYGAGLNASLEAKQEGIRRFAADVFHHFPCPSRG